MLNLCCQAKLKLQVRLLVLPRLMREVQNGFELNFRISTQEAKETIRDSLRIRLYSLKPFKCSPVLVNKILNI